jgi:isoleucyl-tRNA synthetase
MLSLEDFIITSEDIEGWMVATDGELTIALDVMLDDDLRAEGIAREIVNRVQNLRKDSDFEVTDRIHLTIQREEKIAVAIEKYGDYICSEVLATELQIVEGLPNVTEVELLEGLNIKMTISK